MKSLLAVLLLCLCTAGVAAQTGKPASGAKTEKAMTAEASRTSTADQAELDALKADLQRMTNTLNQLRTNLGYVASTTQPLRHQFELEIDLWQMQLGQMERRIQRLEAQAKH